MSKSSNTAVAVLRAYAYACGIPKDYVYNDPISGGRRSVKVIGWQREDYIRALNVLRASGLSGKVIRNKTPWATSPYRIWVD